MDPWSAAGFVALTFLLALYWKGLPGAFHLRLAIAVFRGAFFEGRLRSIREHVTMADRVLPCDMDINMHMNNSIYNLIADISRYHWISRLLSGNLGRARAVKIANGGVSMFFLKEIGFLQRFSVSTYCLGMDQKWRSDLRCGDAPRFARWPDSDPHALTVVAATCA